MQRILFISLVALGATTLSDRAAAEHAWFEFERDAVHALSDGDRLEVFECTQCDADNASHRTTLAFIGHLLEELRAHEQPAQGAFLLRERVQPRYYVDDYVEELAEELAEEAGDEALAYTARSGCGDQGWAPSLTRWEYDLDRDEARPMFSACLAFTEEASPIRMSCKGCDLEQLGDAEDIREQLEAAHWALFEDRVSVASGVIIITDSVNSGFRRLDFRAYRDTVYLGPADGDYYRIPMGTGSEIAQTP